MGVCASSECQDKKVISGSAKSTTTSKGDGDKEISMRAAEASIRSSSTTTTIMVIDLEGGIKELKQAVEAKAVISQNPNCFLCNSESMYVHWHVHATPPGRGDVATCPNLLSHPTLSSQQAIITPSSLGIRSNVLALGVVSSHPR